MFEAAIFDFDGVLVDSEDINIKALSTVFANVRQPLTAAELAAIPGRSSQEMVPLFLRNRGFPESYDRGYISSVRLYYDEFWPSMVKLMPETREVLTCLKRSGITLGIGTTNRTAVVEKFIKKFGFEDVFSFVISGEMVQKRKPAPEVYTLSAERAGRCCLVIEDTGIGLAAAKAAGLCCAVVPNKYSMGQDFSSADYVLPSLAGILPLFR